MAPMLHRHRSAVLTVMLKLYSHEKTLIEDNVFHGAEAGIALKGDVRQFTVLGNTFERIRKIAIRGNMHDTTTHGEVLFNNVRSAGDRARCQPAWYGWSDTYLPQHACWASTGT